MRPLAFSLPYPPSVNHYLLRGARGKVVLSVAARRYKNTAGFAALAVIPEPLTGLLSVTLHVYRPRRVGDLDGVAKVALDSLNGIAWRDDKQIVDLEMHRYDDKKHPRIDVEIEPAKEQR